MTEDLLTIVVRALDNALDNGYNYEYTDAFKTAVDLVNNDAELEDYEPEQLVECVRIWQLKTLGSFE